MSWGSETIATFCWSKSIKLLFFTFESDFGNTNGLVCVGLQVLTKWWNKNISPHNTNIIQNIINILSASQRNLEAKFQRGFIPFCDLFFKKKIKKNFVFSLFGGQHHFETWSFHIRTSWDVCGQKLLEDLFHWAEKNDKSEQN